MLILPDLLGADVVQCSCTRELRAEDMRRSRRQRGKGRGQPAWIHRLLI